MDQATVQTLLRQFSAPLAAYAASSPERKELAEMLVRNLWTAMIAGREMEEETWKALRAIGKLDDGSLHVIQKLYFDQMKPVVNEEQLADLRRRYQLKRCAGRGPEQ
jgi:hypothetical protein